jgi:hypothetical protein
VGLAARGARKLRDNIERIEVQSELAQVRRQASQVQRKSLFSAIGLTALTFLLP